MDDVVLLDTIHDHALAAARLCNFPTGQAVLLPTHKTWLDNTVPRLLRSLPNPWVDLVGYSSHLGNHTFNKRLSDGRCEAVRKHIKSYGLKVSFPVEIGVGDAQSTGAAIDNSGAWRAVEVHIYGSMPPPKPAPRPRLPTVYTPGEVHVHAPSGRWPEIQADPKSSFELNLLCATMSPEELIAAAVFGKFSDKPIALEHLKWYQFDGNGRDFREDDNIKDMLQRDVKIKNAIFYRIRLAQTSGKQAHHFSVTQADYAIEDFYYAFGAIDRLDFEVDSDAQTVHVWFKDFYQFHPVYPGIYKYYPSDGLGELRPDNCVHAAAVELKSSGAADFWMLGEATVPLDVIKPK
jgi:hypothetical protein